MNIKIVEKFDKLLKKSTGGKLDTFEEISEIFAGFITLEVAASHSELMQRIKQSVTFTSMQDLQELLSGYFDFSNAIVAEFEHLESIEDEDVFGKEIRLFTRNILSAVPKESLKEHISNFTVKVIGTILEEYGIEIYDDFEKMAIAVQDALGNEDVAMIFAATAAIVPIMEHEKLSYDAIVDLVVAAFILCFEMNNLRKNAYLKREAFEHAPKPANSLTYNVGRNDSCPCGSGRKYKKCCLNKSKPMPLDKIFFEEPKDVAPALTRNKKQKKAIYQLKISIKGAKPPIWRRVLVESEMSFYALHRTIQAIFNWEDYHLYQFFGNRGNYTDRDSLQEENYFGGKKNYAADVVFVNSELEKKGDKINYIYDFGDDWEHEIVLEEILPYDEGIKYPVCVKGRRDGPMEDCGGIYRFNAIAEAIENPTFDNQYILGDDEESDYYKDFNPKTFDIEWINKKLRAEF